MKKGDLVKELNEKSSLSLNQSKEAVNTLLEIIAESMINDEFIDIAGFGKLEVKHRAERQGINPHTKEKITISASKSVSFKPARALKEKLNQ